MNKFRVGTLCYVVNAESTFWAQYNGHVCEIIRLGSCGTLHLLSPSGAARINCVCVCAVKMHDGRILCVSSWDYLVPINEPGEETEEARHESLKTT